MTPWDSASLLVLTTVCLVGFVIGWLPALRRRSSAVMAGVVGASCWAAAAWLLLPTNDWRPALLGRAERFTGWHVVAVGLAVSGAWACFRAEAWAAAGWAKWRARRLRIPGGVPFLGSSIDRNEAMRAVATSASRPMFFALLSVWALVAEELFYRGAFLQVAHQAGLGAVASIGSQAIWYALNHLAFGPPALLGKALLGLSLGCAAWGFGAIAAVPAHGYFQYLVLAQFLPRPTLEERTASA